MHNQRKMHILLVVRVVLILVVLVALAVLVILVILVWLRRHATTLYRTTRISS